MDAPNAELDKVNGERKTILQNYESSLHLAHKILKLLIPGQALPATPVPGITPAQVTLVNAWLETAQRRAQQVHERREQQAKELKSAKGKLVRAQKRVQILEKSAKPPVERVTDMPKALPPVSAGTDTLLTEEITTLKAALTVEQKRRQIAEDMVTDVRSSTDYLLDDRTRLLKEINAQSRALHKAELGRIVAEETQAQVVLELKERILRLDEFEAMLSTHDQLQQLMSNAIQEAQEARDEAEYARRLADENLRIMRAEFERVRPMVKGQDRTTP
jgi:hypothetical protein